VCGGALSAAPEDDEMAASVRPQKLFSANSTLAWLAGTPFTS